MNEISLPDNTYGERNGIRRSAPAWLWPQYDEFTPEDYQRIRFTEQVEKLHASVCILAMEVLIDQILAGVCYHHESKETHER